MFYALVAIGIIFIFVGVKYYKPLETNIVEETEDESLLNLELDDLKFRIENLEKELYHNKTTSFDEVIESTESFFNSIENYKKVRKYEEENLSIEEISQLLDMKKGEVLLLKNLYKNHKD